MVAALVAACGGSESRRSGVEPHKLRVGTGTVTISFPTAWKLQRSSATQLTFREGTTICTYTVNATATIEHVDAATATEAARSLVPTADGRLLETGERGSAAWRVVKLRGDGTQVRLDAVRAQPLRFISKRDGQPTWLATRLTAASDQGDECHSGTYRDTLGPHLGDALATLRERV